MRIHAFVISATLACTILLPGGCASPREDQAALYAAGRFKRAWFTAQEVAAHAVRTYHPGE